MIKEYLNEELLEQFLATEFSGEIIKNKAYFKGSKCRPDFVLPDHKLVVEFDDHHHYKDHSRAERDLKFDMFMNENYPDWDVIHIPYFVQLDSYGVDYYFGKFINVPELGGLNSSQRGFNEFPHGFIVTKFLPHMFCELGASRFLVEMANFNVIEPRIFVSIFNSLTKYDEFSLRDSTYKSTFNIYNRLNSIENDNTNVVSTILLPKATLPEDNISIWVFENIKKVVFLDSYHIYKDELKLLERFRKIKYYINDGYEVINYPYFMLWTHFAENRFNDIIVTKPLRSIGLVDFMMDTHLTPAKMSQIQKKYYKFTLEQWNNFDSNFYNKYYQSLVDYCDFTECDPLEIFDYNDIKSRNILVVRYNYNLDILNYVDEIYE